MGLLRAKNVVYKLFIPFLESEFIEFLEFSEFSELRNKVCFINNKAYTLMRLCVYAFIRDLNYW